MTGSAVRPYGALGLPSARWELTAPESFVLRHATPAGEAPMRPGPRRFDHKERLGRAALALALTGAGRDRTAAAGPRWAALRRAAGGDGVSDALEPVLALYQRARGRRPEAVSVKALDRALRKTWRGYRAVSRDMGLALCARGMLSEAGSRTSLGQQTANLLEAWLDVGRRQLPRRSADSPWAHAYLDGAGASVLLVRELHPYCFARHNDLPVALNEVNVALGVSGFDRAFGDGGGGGDFDGGE